MDTKKTTIQEAKGILKDMVQQTSLEMMKEIRLEEAQYNKTLYSYETKNTHSL